MIACLSKSPCAWLIFFWVFYSIEFCHSVKVVDTITNAFFTMFTTIFMNQKKWKVCSKQYDKKGDGDRHTYWSTRVEARLNTIQFIKKKWVRDGFEFSISKLPTDNEHKLIEHMHIHHQYTNTKYITHTLIHLQKYTHHMHTTHRTKCYDVIRNSFLFFFFIATRITTSIWWRFHFVSHTSLYILINSSGFFDNNQLDSIRNLIWRKHRKEIYGHKNVKKKKNVWIMNKTSRPFFHINFTAFADPLKHLNSNNLSKKKRS